MKRKAIICDLDGTLCNIDHRVHLIKSENPDWDKFNSLCIKDKINDDVLELLHLFDKNKYKLIIVSGRSIEYYYETASWLAENFVPNNTLFMRDAEDLRSDYLVKKEIYEMQIEHDYDVKFVLEDRDAVVEMWRGLGLRCFQVAKGEY